LNATQFTNNDTDSYFQSAEKHKLLIYNAVKMLIQK